MGKIKVLAILEVEEDFNIDDSKYFKVENIRQDMILSFSKLQIDLYHREVRKNGNVIEFTNLEFRILHYAGKRFIGINLFSASFQRGLL